MKLIHEAKELIVVTGILLRALKVKKRALKVKMRALNVKLGALD